MSVVLRPWLLRSRRRAGLLTVLAVIAAVLAAVATTALALVLQAPTTELRAALHALPVSARSVSIEASGDPAAQDRAFRRLVGRAFGDVPVRVDTSVTGDTTTWSVRADADRVTAAELGGLRHGFEALPDTAAEHFAEDGGASTRNAAVVRGDTDVLLAAVSAVRSTAPVPLSIVVVAGAVTLFLAGRLLTGARAAEDRLFRARGASYGRLAGAAAAEGLVVGLVGAAVGGAAGVLLARALGAGAAPATVVVWAGIAGSRSSPSAPSWRRASPTRGQPMRGQPMRERPARERQTRDRPARPHVPAQCAAARSSSSSWCSPPSRSGATAMPRPLARETCSP
ncbi:hypothetical protein P9139_14615 [Curtobacterium flaccumfaciens]|nr:hypothetical protein P9139_14615 [Curtobacterium flaccumfaciens]